MENTEKFENGKEIWMANNKDHEFAILKMNIRMDTYFFLRFGIQIMQNHYDLPTVTSRLYLAFQERLYTDDIPQLKGEGYPDVDLFRIEADRGLIHCLVLEMIENLLMSLKKMRQ